MDISQFEKIKVLGQGTFGKCYLANDKKTNQLCVIKQIDVNGMSDKQKKETLKQARILEALDHPSIIKFLGTFNTKGGYINILMAYADGGDMAKKIKQAKGYFDQNKILNWFTQICLAIKHVHDRKIIHRDLKCENIFLTKNNLIKLGDFGIAKALKLTIQKIKSVVGTPYYMSPQICDNKDYSFKTDIWSLGVILYQICALKQPFQANSLAGLALKITKGQYSPLPSFYSRDLKKLVNELLTVDPAKRPSIMQVLKTPIIQSRIANYVNLNESAPIVLNQKKQKINQQTVLDKMQNANSKKKIGSILSPHSVMQNPLFPVQTPQYKCADISFKLKQNISNQKQKQPSNDRFESNGNKKGVNREMRRRQISQPNLTPKMYNNRIQQTQRPFYNADKYQKLRSNISQVNLQKRKLEKIGGIISQRSNVQQKMVKMKKRQQKFQEGKVERKSQQILKQFTEIKQIKNSFEKEIKQDQQIIDKLNTKRMQLNQIEKYFKEYPPQQLQEILLEDHKPQVSKQVELNYSVSKVMKKYEGRDQQLQFSYQTQLETLKWVLQSRINPDKLTKVLNILERENGIMGESEFPFLNEQQNKCIGLVIVYNHIKMYD